MASSGFPPLPEELQAVWHRFRDDYPLRLRGAHGVKLGAVLLVTMSMVVNDLGQHALANQALSSKKPRIASGGNPKAFEDFIRGALKIKPGSNTLRL